MWKKKGRSSSILPRLSLGCARAPLNSTMVTKTWRFKRNSAQNVLYPVTYSRANPLHVTLIHFYSPLNLNQVLLQTFDCTYLKKKKKAIIIIIIKRSSILLARNRLFWISKSGLVIDTIATWWMYCRNDSSSGNKEKKNIEFELR